MHFQINLMMTSGQVFWKDDVMRTPLSLESYAARALLRTELPNVGPETVPRHLCNEFDKIRNIHGKFISHSLRLLYLVIIKSSIISG